MLVGTNGSEAATWILVGDEPTLTVEVDRDGIAREGSLVKARFRWNYNPAQIAISKQNPFQSMKELNYFDCRKRQYAIAQRIGYEERDAQGQTVFRASVPSSNLEYSEVVPESMVNRCSCTSANSRVRKADSSHVVFAWAPCEDRRALAVHCPECGATGPVRRRPCSRGISTSGDCRS